MLATIGTLCVAAFALYILAAIYKYFLRPGLNLKKYGDWAVVTGATDGIGKALAHELAKKGLNIVLISRTQSKLNEVAQDIETKHKRQTVSIAVDFSNFSEADKSTVKSALQDLPIAVLVNNVGMSYSYPQYFNDGECKEQLADFKTLLDLNVVSCVEMTRIVLPLMEARKKGVVVNMSSGSSVMGGCPNLTMYAASKQYINEFSLGLHYEYAGKKETSKHDIRVQAQTPLYVASKLSKMRAGFSCPDPKVFARVSVKQMGQEPIISPFWVHALMLWAMSLIPSGFLMQKIKGLHLSIRKKALKKYAKTE